MRVLVADNDPLTLAALKHLGLTLRQADVLKQLVQRKPNKLICRDLRLSEPTVKAHVSAILKALQVHTRTEAVAELARRGIGVETIYAALSVGAEAAITRQHFSGCARH